MTRKEMLHYYSCIASLEKYHCEEIGVEPDWNNLAKTILDDITFQVDDVCVDDWMKQQEKCKKLGIKIDKKLGEKIYDLCSMRISLDYRRMKQLLRVYGLEKLL